MSRESTRIVADIIQANANDIANSAAQKAPRLFKTQNGGFPTNGEIVQSIAVEQKSPLKYAVSVNSVMGAYAEFGTGAFVDVPEGWQDIAWSYYKNGKGTIMPTPYFIPAFRAGKEQTINDINDYLSNLAK